MSVLSLTSSFALLSLVGMMPKFTWLQYMQMVGASTTTAGLLYGLSTDNKYRNMYMVGTKQFQDYLFNTKHGGR